MYYNKIKECIFQISVRCCVVRHSLLFSCWYRTTLLQTRTRVKPFVYLKRLYLLIYLSIYLYLYLSVIMHTQLYTYIHNIKKHNTHVSIRGVLFHVTLNETKIPPINVFQPANGVWVFPSFVSIEPNICLTKLLHCPQQIESYVRVSRGII